MKKLLTIAFVALTILANAQTSSIQKSAPLSPASPESVGMSPERLDRIDAMCKEAIKNNEVPGIVALVARKGKIVFHEAYGMADNASSRKMKADDIFNRQVQPRSCWAVAGKLNYFHRRPPIKYPHNW